MLLFPLSHLTPCPVFHCPATAYNSPSMNSSTPHPISRLKQTPQNHHRSSPKGYPPNQIQISPGNLNSFGHHVPLRPPQLCLLPHHHEANIGTRTRHQHDPLPLLPHPRPNDRMLPLLGVPRQRQSIRGRRDTGAMPDTQGLWASR